MRANRRIVSDAKRQKHYKWFYLLIRGAFGRVRAFRAPNTLPEKSKYSRASRKRFVRPFLSFLPFRFLMATNHVDIRFISRESGAWVFMLLREREGKSI